MSEEPVAVEQTEEEWRAERFTEEEIASAKHVDAVMAGRQPTFNQLKDAAEQYGPEGILESALHLHRKDFERLEAIVRKMPGTRAVRRRRRNGR